MVSDIYFSKIVMFPFSCIEITLIFLKLVFKTHEEAILDMCAFAFCRYLRICNIVSLRTQFIGGVVTNCEIYELFY